MPIDDCSVEKQRECEVLKKVGEIAGKTERSYTVARGGCKPPGTAAELELEKAGKAFTRYLQRKTEPE